jgi:hypothetical protein
MLNETAKFRDLITQLVIGFCQGGGMRIMDELLEAHIDTVIRDQFFNKVSCAIRVLLVVLLLSNGSTRVYEAYSGDRKGRLLGESAL